MYSNYDLNEIVTPINTDKLTHYLKLSQYNPKKSAYLVHGFKHGFDLGYRGPVVRQSLANNLPLMVGSPVELWNKLMKEVQLKRVAGPYDHIPYNSHI